MNQTVARLGICCAVAIGLSLPVHAAGKPKSVAPDAVQELLQTEPQAANRSVDRRDVLKPGTQPENDSNAAWWQAGYIQSGKQWLKFEDSLASGESLVLLDEYRTQRMKLTSQPHGEWQLANWCRKNGLPDQERVHLLRVLYERDSTAKADVVYERLGCQKIDEVWVSPQQRQDAKRQKSEIEQSHKRWDSKFTSLTQQLEGSAKQRALAEKQLSEVTDPSAVPAIISSFCMQSQPLAEYGVKTLGQIPEYQASRALAGQAVFSPWKSVRMRSVELLKQRKLEEFVPDLLLLLSCPARIEVAPSAENRIHCGKINWDYAWIEETQDTVLVGIGRLVPIAFTTGIQETLSRRRGSDTFTEIPLHLERSNNTSEGLYELKFEAERSSDNRVGMNERVAKILSDCSNEPMSSDPKDWWNWWNTYSSVSPGQKKTVVVKAKERVVLAPQVEVVFRVAVVSCFAAGMQVWTERGSVAIEQIVPGDRVLSKEVHSGELIYKPVLQTTVRQPTSVHKIHLADDEIVASLGHHFWVSGEGWTKTKQLAADQPLHTATGMQRITSIEDEGHIETVYNLVIADFHTYFVGKSMVLSHDVTTPQLTNIKVPGLLPK